jgi:hypothetical protein
VLETTHIKAISAGGEHRVEPLLVRAELGGVGHGFGDLPMAVKWMSNELAI